MAQTIEWPPGPRPPRRSRPVFLAVLAIIVLGVFGAGSALSYYVYALWFDSLGYVEVFWKTLSLQSAIFTGFAAITFLILYGSYLALKPAGLGEIAGGAILINGRPLRLPVEPVLRL